MFLPELKKATEPFFFRLHTSFEGSLYFTIDIKNNKTVVKYRSGSFTKDVYYVTRIFTFAIDSGVMFYAFETYGNHDPLGFMLWLDGIGTKDIDLMKMEMSISGYKYFPF